MQQGPAASPSAAITRKQNPPPRVSAARACARPPEKEEGGGCNGAEGRNGGGRVTASRVTPLHAHTEPFPPAPSHPKPAALSPSAPAPLPAPSARRQGVQEAEGGGTGLTSAATAGARGPPHANRHRTARGCFSPRTLAEKTSALAPCGFRTRASQSPGGGEKQHLLPPKRYHKPIGKKKKQQLSKFTKKRQKAWHVLIKASGNSFCPEPTHGSKWAATDQLGSFAVNGGTQVSSSPTPHIAPAWGQLLGLLLPPFGLTLSSDSPGALRGGSGQSCESPAVHQRKKIQGILGDAEGFVQAQAHRRLRHRPYLCAGLLQAPSLPGSSASTGSDEQCCPVQLPTSAQCEAEGLPWLCGTAAVPVFPSLERQKQSLPAQPLPSPAPSAAKPVGRIKKWNELSTQAQLTDAAWKSEAPD